MKRLLANSTGHIIADLDGKHMLVDTGAARSFYDEYRGVRVGDLSNLIGVSLQGVLGMDSLQGKVISLSRRTIQLDGVSPENSGTPLIYISDIPSIDIKINEIPCCAAIITGLTATYLSERLLSRDKHSRTVDDIHPAYGTINVRTFANYFSIGDKNYFADAGELPDGFSLLSSTPVDAIIGADLLNRFNLIMDFAKDRLHLVSQ